MPILISGASVAGLTAAQRFSAQGVEVTVVERAPGLRRQGAPLDVRGDALAVATDMGIGEMLAAHETGAARRSAFAHFVDAHGRRVGALPNALPQESADDLELFRSDLIDILRGSLGPEVTIMFGDSIADVADTGDGVEVGFASGRAGRYDFLIGADGIHSNTRRLVFGPEERYRRHLDVYYCILTLPKDLGGDGEVCIYSEPGRSVLIAGYADQAAGGLLFLSSEIDYDYHDAEQQRQLVIETCGTMRGWKSSAVIEALKQTDQFYVDSASQVHMDHWWRGRVVLLGDSAFAPSFFSGRGTPLAMVGADVLATEWSASKEDLAQAFGRYEDIMRPRVQVAQQGVPQARDRIIPATWEAIENRKSAVATGELRPRLD